MFSGHTYSIQPINAEGIQQQYVRADVMTAEGRENHHCYHLARDILAQWGTEKVRYSKSDIVFIACSAKTAASTRQIDQ